MRLYEYQIEAIKNMKNGCILNGGVGSGKSITALGYYYIQNGGSWDFLRGGEYGPMDDPPKDLYIITTARKRETKEWEMELGRYLMSVHPDTNLYRHKIIVDSWNNIGKYKDVTNAFFMFDEQKVSGKGAWVKTFLKLAKVNEWILLSATAGDCWNDFAPVFIANGFFKNRTEFNNDHVKFSRHTDFPKIEGYYNTGRLLRLRNSILVDMEFNRKTIRHNEDVYVQYDIQAYKDVFRNRWNIFEDKPIETASELCYTLRKVVNTHESRQAAVLNILEKSPRAIIFYNFDSELEILRNLAYMPGTEIAEWNGHKHQDIPLGERWVYLVHYNAAEAWNCIRTDTIIFYSQNYSYKTLEQASGRIDRMNTTYRDLYYYHLKSRSGIDLAISKALSSKKKFNETRWVNGK